MKDYEVLCTDMTRVEFQAHDDASARYVGFNAATDAGKVVFSVLPKGCTGLSPHAHLGRRCPVHP